MARRRRAGARARRAARRRGRLGRALGRRALTEPRRRPPAADRRPRRAGAGRADQFLRLRAAAGGAAAVPVHRRPHVRRRSARPLRLCGADRRIRRAARDARAEARARPAARAHRQAARLRGLGRAAGRGDRLGRWRWRCCSLFPQAMFPNSEITRARMAAADHGHRARLVGHHASPRSPIATTSARRSARGRSSSRGRSASPPSRWSFISTARRADHRLCAVDGRRADRVDDPVPQELRPAARLEPRPGRRCGGWRGATCRSPPPTRSNGDRAGSTSRCSACSSRRRSSASIMSRRTSPRCRRS